MSVPTHPVIGATDARAFIGLLLKPDPFDLIKRDRIAGAVAATPGAKGTITAQVAGVCTVLASLSSVVVNIPLVLWPMNGP